jgi:hypothetical protein
MKEGQKIGIFGSFSEIVHMPVELILNKKYVFLMYRRFKKKSALKLLDRTVYKRQI